jgi:hypothetical protein
VLPNETAVIDPKYFPFTVISIPEEAFDGSIDVISGTFSRTVKATSFEVCLSVLIDTTVEPGNEPAGTTVSISVSVFVTMSEEILPNITAVADVKFLPLNATASPITPCVGVTVSIEVWVSRVHRRLKNP